MSANDAKSIIDGLSKPFDRAVIKKKPGSKPGADRFKPATDYVSHGLVTKRLNDIAPGWSSRVVEWHSYIDPKGVLICAGVTLEVTIPGAGSHQEFGKSANRIGFGDDAKNALSDALKRCAMRFGVAIDLWESAEEHDEDAQDADESQFHALRPPVQHAPVQRAQQAPQPPQPARMFTADEYKAVIKEAWRMRKKDGDDYLVISAYLRANRSRMTPDQFEDCTEEGKKLKAWTPEGVPA